MSDFPLLSYCHLYYPRIVLHPPATHSPYHFLTSLLSYTTHLALVRAAEAAHASMRSPLGDHLTCLRVFERFDDSLSI